jgi:lipopolysaccharide export system protein LptC
MQHDRYTRVVRLLKVLLPATAVALILAVFLFPRTLLMDSLNLSGLSFNPSEGLRLLSPHFTGTTDSGDPFDVRAEWALPDAPDPAHIGLGPLVGGIELKTGETLRLTAAAGDYRPKERALSLRDGVTIESGSGYRLSVTEADIDIAAERLKARGPVEGAGEAGEISSGSMRVERRDGNNYIWFEDGVRVIVTPSNTSLP